MGTRRFLVAFTGLLVMGLPALAGAYYYSRFAPEIDALAEAEQNLPGDCKLLNHKLHKFLMHAQPKSLVKMARTEREEGVRLCATGSQKKGMHQLRVALERLGVRPET